jgi:hypothetical protein
MEYDPELRQDGLLFGNLGYAVLWWDRGIEKWQLYGIVATKDQAEAMKQYSLSKTGCEEQLTLVYRLREVMP